MSGNVLKFIAIITMLIDHIGAVIIENGILHAQDLEKFSAILATPQGQLIWNADFVVRCIGRLAFPIFCFLLVEGFQYTRNVRKYAMRLGIFALVSEIPFDLAINGQVFSLTTQNVYFTLLLGLIALAGVQKFPREFWKQAVVILGCSVLAWFMHTDYGAFGVLFIVMLYLLRYERVAQTAVGTLMLCWELPAVLSFIPIRLYNGTRGKKNWKYLFYGFYPVHLLILWGIRWLVFGY